MPLKRKYAQQSDIPKGLESLYTEKDGEWILEVEGVVSVERFNEVNGKLSEFRTNNISIRQELEALKGKKHLSDEEYERFQQLSEQQQKIQDKELIDKGDVEKLVAQRTDKMRKELEAQRTDAMNAAKKEQERAQRLHSNLQTERVRSQLSSVLTDIAVPVKGAMSDIYNRANGIWQLDDEGNLIARNPDGTDIYGSDDKPLSMKEFAADLVKTAPYLFEASKGGAARGGGSQQQSTGNKRVVANDHQSISANLEAIAKGDMVVSAD